MCLVFIDGFYPCFLSSYSELKWYPLIDIQYLETLAGCEFLRQFAVLASSRATWSTTSVHNIFISLRGSCNICAAPCGWNKGKDFARDRSITPATTIKVKPCLILGSFVYEFHRSWADTNAGCLVGNLMIRPCELGACPFLINWTHMLFLIAGKYLTLLESDAMPFSEQKHAGRVSCRTWFLKQVMS